MRLLWWIIYGVKVKFIMFIAMLICFIISRVFDKKVILIYILAAIVAITASIYVGVSTFRDLDFPHPILTFIGATVISVIIDTCSLVMSPTRAKECAGNVEDV